MSQIIEVLNQWLLAFAHTVPLEVYAFVGGLLEEIIAPIPSPIVMTTAGGLLKLNGGLLIGIVWLSLIAGVSKTLGSMVLYWGADIAEDLVVGKFGKYLGLSHKVIENIGKKFKGGWKDVAMMTFLRALPVIPGAPVAVTAGLIKMDLKTYLIGTYLGTFLRSLFFAYIGYIGAESYQHIIEGLDNIESILTVVVIVLLMAGIWYVKKISEKSEKFEA